MKKITAIFFFSVYLLTMTEAHQLLKLPVVFQHFNEHKKEDKGISFAHFLGMHYLHGSPKDKDYNRDMQLPFKTSADCIASTTADFTPLMTHYSVTAPVLIVEKQRFITKDQYHLSPHLPNIWQPPKSC